MAPPRPEFIGPVELPWEPGRHVGDTIYWQSVAPIGLDRGAAPTDVLATHTLFHHGFIIAVTGRDPAAAYWAEQGLREKIHFFELGCKLFTGEMPAPYDRVLYACPRPLWPGLERHFNRLSFRADHGPGRSVIWNCIHYLYPVLDPIRGRQLVQGRPAPAEPPRIPVHLFGFASTVGEYVWVPPRDLWREPACLTFQRPAPPRPITTPSSSRSGKRR